MTHLSTTTRPRLLSRADCEAIAQRISGVTQGGGYSVIHIWSSWQGNIRWARNQITSSGEVRNDYVKVLRNVNAAENEWTLVNNLSDESLVALVRRAERMARIHPEENPQVDLLSRWWHEPDPTPAPELFFDATYNLDDEHRAEAAVTLTRAAADAGMLSAGYIEVGAYSMAIIDTLGHPPRYTSYTTAQLSMTVRDPQGVGSGWAGVDWPDWRKIDGNALAATALNKCLMSRHPSAVEPGRYTTILEPQAVCDFADWYMSAGESPVCMVRDFKGNVGKQFVDPRITISSDPLDPNLAFPPWDPMSGSDNIQGSGAWFNYDVYHKATRIDRGIGKQPCYGRGTTTPGLANQGAWRMSGGESTIEEMISSTRRGLLVTRFDHVDNIDEASTLMHGYTRDGLWLIENGKISKSVKNMTFTESILFAFNNVEMLGIPQRVFHPKFPSLAELPHPVIVPALKVRDFSFTAICDAV